MIRKLETEAELKFAHEILWPLLENEDGTLMSMAEWVGVTNHNDLVIRYAKMLGVEFTPEELTEIGRK